MFISNLNMSTSLLANPLSPPSVPAPTPPSFPSFPNFLFYLQVLAKLPPAHLRTLRHCVALLRELADNEPTTKMSEANCAMVFAPNLLRSRANDTMLFARNQENESRFIHARLGLNLKNTVFWLELGAHTG